MQAHRVDHIGLLHGEPIRGRRTEEIEGGAMKQRLYIDVNAGAGRMNCREKKAAGLRFLK